MNKDLKLFLKWHLTKNTQNWEFCHLFTPVSNVFKVLSLKNILYKAIGSLWPNVNNVIQIDTFDTGDEGKKRKFFTNEPFVSHRRKSYGSKTTWWLNDTFVIFGWPVSLRAAPLIMLYLPGVKQRRLIQRHSERSYNHQLEQQSQEQRDHSSQQHSHNQCL